jgi:hypothetical protein
MAQGRHQSEPELMIVPISPSSSIHTAMLVVSDMACEGTAGPDPDAAIGTNIFQMLRKTFRHIYYR